MANHLDLEEQEQIDQLKHFWNTWGTLITFVILMIFASFTAWNGYNFWKNRESLQATALLDAVEDAGKLRDQVRLEQAFADIRTKHASTIQAGQAGLFVAKFEMEKNNLDSAQSALEWVAAHASDGGYKALAQLRLVSIFIEKKSYDKALNQLSYKFPVDFNLIAADRKADILFLQNKKQEAIIEYNSSYGISNVETDYNNLIEVKLSRLGAKPLVAVGLTTEREIK